MQNPNVLFSPQPEIANAVAQFPTPFFLYSEERIRQNCQRVKSAFAKHFPRFTPLYAVKANANPHILKIIQSEGFGFDCSSLSEAWITKKLGAHGMHTGNYVTEEELGFVLKTPHIILNLDDASMLATVAKIGVPQTLSFRVNPGIGGATEIASNTLAGPDAKYGIPFEKAGDAYRSARDCGVTRFGMHMMTGSNILDADYFGEITKKLLEIVAQVKEETGIEIDFLNIGGGFGVPYRPEENSLDLEAVAAGVRSAFDEQRKKYGLKEPELFVEPGRYITADAGWLVGKVIVIKEGYKKFVGIDASANDMPRPSIYGAYHYASVLGGEGRETESVSIVGSICENNDQFAKDRILPKLLVGDVAIIHNSGGHAYAMGHNYNGKTRSAEYLIQLDGTIRQIRRAETIEDLFATIS